MKATRRREEQTWLREYAKSLGLRLWVHPSNDEIWVYRVGSDTPLGTVPVGQSAETWLQGFESGYKIGKVEKE